jgi:hypothetical protein
VPQLNSTQITRAAAWELGIVDSGEDLSSQQYSDAMLLTNNLLDSWTNEQVLFLKQTLLAFTLAGGTYTPGTMLQFPDLLTYMSVPAGYARALILNLAIELASTYDVDPSASLVRQAAEARAAACPLLGKLGGTPVPFGVAAAAAPAAAG